MKKKAIIWGIGGTARDFYEKEGYYKNYEIVAFTDNNLLYNGMSYHNVPIICPDEINSFEADVIIICSLYENEIKKQIENMNLLGMSIISLRDIEEEIKQRLIASNSKSNSPEIKAALKYYESNELNVFGSYNPDTEKYYIQREEDGSPYVVFEGKKMYFPTNYRFIKDEKGNYVTDILYEQKEDSPHLYVRGESDIKEGSVIVDAGTCEGNFALRYIERVKKVYLFEPSEVWMQALRKTFRPYKDKVVFCDKFLGRYHSDTTVTLDEIVEERIDFLKMDIEGAEIDALLGAKETLKKSDCKCAICAYHRQNDEENIRFILSGLGYDTDVSTGCMFFEYDKGIVETLDFRHGIVYAQKKIMLC